MKWYRVKQVWMCIVIGMMILALAGCSDDNDDGDPKNGLLVNRTPYPVQINFMGIKIIQIAPNIAVREYAFEEGKTYQVQVTVFDNAGNAQEVTNHSIYIDKSANDHTIEDNQRCSWFIRIWGEALPFTVESGS